MHVRFVDVDGVTTRVLSAGSAGPAVLLVHGVGLSADTWAPTLRGLCDGARLYAPDLLWHGFTGGAPLPAGHSPHPRLLQHLERMMDVLGLDDVTVVGSSFGALLGALTHLRRPDRVTKLVIVGSGSCFDDEASLVEMLGNAHANAVRAMRRGTSDAWLARLQNICFDPSAVPPEIIPPLATAYAQPGAVERFEQFMNARRDIELERPYRITERLGEITAPTLVIWGKQEMRGDLDSARKAVREIPRGRLVAYDHCGHLPFLERTTRFNEDVREFVHAGE